ncbi:HmsD [Glaesserella sp.]|uniref:HmsD n=1 Tax=Glaesserella sp. TaxID=2094731 RepID=UPI00359F7841
MELQDSMIINKSPRDLPFTLTFKSRSITLITWLLWGYSLYMMYYYAPKIFAMPVLEQFFFHQIVAFMFIGSAILLVFTVIWSFIAKSYKR